MPQESVSVIIFKRMIQAKSAFPKKRISFYPHHIYPLFQVRESNIFLVDDVVESIPSGW